MGKFNWRYGKFPMNKIIKFIFSIFFALVLAFVFNFFFLGLLERPLIDRAILMFFLSAALMYIFFSILNGRVSIGGKGQAKSSLRGFSLRENMPGILLALSFFAVYLYFGLQLNHPSIVGVDNLFDADVSSWMIRFSAPDVKYYEMRGPHPFSYFIFRPFGWFLNLFTNNPPLSSILLNTFSGGLCVYLAWLFIYRQFKNNVYAFLMAGLLGLSTSHFFFGSVVETYIFSALALILFFLLLQSKQRSIVSLILASILTFGITFTNFIQNCIGFIVFRPRWKEFLRFIAWTVSLSIILSFLHAAWYPSSKLFFLLSSVQNEEKFIFGIFQMPKWRVVGRIVLLVRTIFLYTIIAPNVYALREEVGSYIPQFSFFKIVPGTFSHSAYDGLGEILVMTWAIMLFTSGLMFLWNLIRTRKTDLSLAFALCIAFNFILHINYGWEPFLYSPGWAYALVFFVAFGLASFRENRFFQTGLLMFLIFLAYNQWKFIMFILNTLVLYNDFGG